MKKILAIVMALVMLMAITVPAFAEKVSAPGDTNVDVITSTQDINGNDAYSYSVEIPATFTFAWNDTDPKDAFYTVTSQLLIGASLDVTVAAVNGGEMTANGTTATLTYTLTDAGVTHFTEVNNAAAPADVGGANAKIAITSFANVPVAEYTGTVTYTVTYNAPVTP